MIEYNKKTEKAKEIKDFFDILKDKNIEYKEIKINNIDYIYIDDDLNISYCGLKYIPENLYIKGNFTFIHNYVEKIPDSLIVEKNIWFYNNKIKQISNNFDLYFSNHKINTKSYDYIITKKKVIKRNLDQIIYFAECIGNVNNFLKDTLKFVTIEKLLNVKGICYDNTSHNMFYINKIIKNLKKYEEDLIETKDILFELEVCFDDVLRSENSNFNNFFLRNNNLKNIK